MRCEIQECGKYQPCRIFIENASAVGITMSSAKSQAAICKSKFGVKQHDKVMMKKDMLTEIQIMKRKDKKTQKRLITTSLELILIKKF